MPEEKPKIVVCLSGGCITSIYGSIADMDVEVIDFDDVEVWNQDAVLKQAIIATPHVVY